MLQSLLRQSRSNQAYTCLVGALGPILEMRGLLRKEDARYN